MTKKRAFPHWPVTIAGCYLWQNKRKKIKGSIALENLKITCNFFVITSLVFLVTLHLSNICYTSHMFSFRSQCKFEFREVLVQLTSTVRACLTAILVHFTSSVPLTCAVLVQFLMKLTKTKNLEEVLLSVRSTWLRDKKVRASKTLYLVNIVKKSGKFINKLTLFHPSLFLRNLIVQFMNISR